MRFDQIHIQPNRASLESGIWNLEPRRAGKGTLSPSLSPARLEPRLEAFEGRDRIVDSWRPLGHEALAELDADQEAEVAGARLDRLEEALLREHGLRLLRLRVVELAREAADRGAPCLHRGRDVHDEVGRVHVRRGEVDRLLRAVRGMRGLDLPQPRVVRGVGDESRPRGGGRGGGRRDRT